MSRMAFVISLGVLLVPRIAAGCVIMAKPTVLDAYKNADVVVIARAISVEHVSDQSETPLNASRVLSTTMEVEKVFKGNLRIGDKMTLICRYHPTKRASVNNYFINMQKERTKELIQTATSITIVGAQCFHTTDVHIWEPLSKTTAELFYIEPGQSGQGLFKDWAIACGKREGFNFHVIPKTFKDAFDTILKVNELS